MKGRPPAAGVARSAVRTFRLTAQEAGELEAKARERGMRVPDYLRWLVRRDAPGTRGEGSDE